MMTRYLLQAIDRRLVPFRGEYWMVLPIILGLLFFKSPTLLTTRSTIPALGNDIVYFIQEKAVSVFRDWVSNASQHFPSLSRHL